MQMDAKGMVRNSLSGKDLQTDAIRCKPKADTLNLRVEGSNPSRFIG